MRRLRGLPLTSQEKTAVRTLAIIAILLFLGIVFVSPTTLSIIQFWNKPLGPTLGLPTETATPHPTQGVFKTSTPRPTVTALPAVTLRPTLTPNAQPFCSGNIEPTYLLLIGSDTRSNNYLYGIADVIRIVRIDYVVPSITVLEFPRDLWVSIPDMENRYKIDAGKLGQAYFYGNPGMGYYKGQGEGPGLLARALSYNFGIRVDNYIAVNMQTFAKLVDSLGGLDIYLPAEVDGRAPDQATRSDLYFGMGAHHLEGNQALMLARLRPGTVFERASRQNLLMCALRDKILSPAIFNALLKTYDTFKNSIQTDLSPTQVTQLACMASQTDKAQVIFAKFPDDAFTSAKKYDPYAKADTFIYESDFTMLRTMLRMFEVGTWPSIQKNSLSTPQGNDNAFFCP